jgi:hypothetical protein
MAVAALKHGAAAVDIGRWSREHIAMLGANEMNGAACRPHAYDYGTKRRLENARFCGACGG